MASTRVRPIRERRARPSVPSTSNAGIKSFHAVVLRTFPTETVREFWRPILPTFGGMTEPEVYRHIWNEGGVSPGVVLLQMSRRLERLLWENGKDIGPVVDALLAHMGRGSYVQAREFLKRVHWVLPRLFRAKDPHRVVLQIVAANAEKEFPGARIYYDRVRSAAGVNTVLGSLDTPVAYDADLFASRLLQMTPVAFGLPPFEGPVVPLSDSRPAAEAVWEDRVRVRDGVFHVGGRAHGRTMRFSRFLREIHMTRPPWSFPDSVVVTMLEDYVCPLRRRIVLHAGCAYGAPFMVARFRWKPVPPNPDAYLMPMTLDLTLKESDEIELVEQRQRELLAATERTVVVEYQAARGSISLDGAILFSGTPARILRHMLRPYVANRKDTFEFRDFKYDAEITRHPKQSGFETHLARLVEKLAATDCMRIEKVGRGKLRFVAFVPLVFREMP